MKKALLLTLLVVFVTKFSQAQTWCAPGAEWLYRVYQVGYLFQQDGFLNVKIESSYTLGGTDYHILSGTFYGKTVQSGNATTTISNMYRATTYESNKVVYVSRSSALVYDTIANFNAAIGDKWLKPDLYSYCQPTQTTGIQLRYITVLDTGHVLINNNSLKKLVLSLQLSSTSNTVTMIEKIGGLEAFMHPYCTGGVDVWNLGNFACYSDNNFPSYKNPKYQLPCDFTTVGKEEFTLEGLQLNVIPNPCSDNIKIEFRVENVPDYFKVQIIDLLGKVVYSETCNSGNSINTSQLKVGLYTLNIFSDGQVLARRKLMKDSN